jgi:bacteriocin-like protein
MENFYTESIEELTDEQLAQVTGGAGLVGAVLSQAGIDSNTAGQATSTAAAVATLLGQPGGLGSSVLGGNQNAGAGLTFATKLVGGLLAG